jgi:hypothetical protein
MQRVERFASEAEEQNLRAELGRLEACLSALRDERSAIAFQLSRVTQERDRVRRHLDYLTGELGGEAGGCGCG